MDNIITFIDKSVEYFYFLFKQKLLFFPILIFVVIIYFYNEYTQRDIHYGEVDIYSGGDTYFTELNSIQEKISPVSQLKIDFLTSANIGFGIKESKFAENEQSLIVLDGSKGSTFSVLEDKIDIFKNELTIENIFYKYYELSTKKEQQLVFLNNFFEDEELLKKYGLTKDPEKFSISSQSFVITYSSGSKYDVNEVKFKIGVKSYDRKYILPILIEFSKFLNNTLNRDIRDKVYSFIESNKQMVTFQRNLLNEQLDILRDNYYILLDDELTKLKENLNIAKSLGYQKSYYFKEFMIGPNQKSYKNVSYCDGDQTTLYCIGYDALQKKIDSLLERKQPEPFIKGYREIQAALKQLEVSSIASIAEILTSEYDFEAYKNYVELDEYSISYKRTNESLRSNVAVVVFGILLFLFIALIKKIYIDAKKNNQ